jgi:hypothetical protein
MHAIDERFKDEFFTLIENFHRCGFDLNTYVSLLCTRRRVGGHFLSLVATIKWMLTISLQNTERIFRSIIQKWDFDEYRPLQTGTWRHWNEDGTWEEKPVQPAKSLDEGKQEQRKRSETSKQEQGRLHAVDLIDTAWLKRDARKVSERVTV